MLKNAFKVFRSSCVTDWARDHAVHVVAAWAGHTVAVAGKHYLTLTDSDWVKATSSVITLNPTVASTGSSISQAAQIVGVFSHESPEKPATSVTQKVTQKVTYSEQKMAGNDGKDEKDQKSQVVDLQEVTATCQILPAITIYPARIRKTSKNPQKNEVLNHSDVKSDVPDSRGVLHQALKQMAKGFRRA